ncbi:hypothetical protein [Campylobacter fetus]|nr:hypothetical protein [Campylobacter fetus]
MCCNYLENANNITFKNLFLKDVILMFADDNICVEIKLSFMAN